MGLADSIRAAKPPEAPKHPNGWTPGVQWSPTKGGEIVTCVVDGMDADVGGQTGHVGAAVVDAEPEPSGQPGQIWCRLDRVIQIFHPRAHINHAAEAAGKR